MTELALAKTPSSERPVAISVDRLNIEYRVYEDTTGRSREFFTRRFRSRTSTKIHAVKDVSFDVAVGEAVGIVGSNGSGKSTLLRAIAGLQSKASGRVLTRGEARLLGVGASLKPELSGYRNVMLGGLAMGIPRPEIQEQLEAVADFSGLGRAMVRPMATYSSGMRARLAFSIATLRVPDILLIDEALAVGDRDFRTKSLERINQIRDQAGTVVMVTHNLGEIRNTCERVIRLEMGRVVDDGDVETVLQAYEQEAVG